MQPILSHGVTGILVGVAFGASALAQDAGTAPGSAAAGLQEIVVTATRREERLQDIPQSVTAFTQENLDVQGLRNIDDVTRLTPGLTFQRNGSGSSANYNDENSDINIRGIDSTAGTATTGLYIDDTPIQTRRIGFGTLNAFPSVFDLDRIEVLRGPQGTLFGAGSEGGAVRFIAPQPALDKNSLYARSEVAGTENGAISFEEGAAAGGPIIDGVLGFRASASYRQDGGYVDRVNYATASIVQPNANRQETVTFRAALKWQPTDALAVTPSFYFQDLHINDTAVYWPSLSDPSAGRFRNGNAQRNPSTDPFYLVALRAELNMGWAQLVSNSSFYSRNQHSTSDYSQYLRTVYLHNPFPQPGDIGSAFFTDTQNNAYQELRLLSSDPAARLTWNAGVFLARLNENSTEYEKDSTLNQEYFAANGTPFCTATAPCPGNVIFMQPYAKVVDRQYAAFGEINLRMVDTLKATLGVRVARVKYTGTSQLAGPDGPGATLLGSASGAQTPVTPKAVLTWQPEHGQLFYASVAKGYRVGGTNIDLGQTTSCLPDLTSLGIQPGSDGVRHSPTTYQSDSLWSYEVGSKSTLLERRVQIDASLFTVDWRDIQQSVYLPTCGEQFTANLGRVRSHGGDIAVMLLPIPALAVNLTAAYTDAKYTHTACLPGLTFSAGACLSGAGAVVGSPIVSSKDRLVGAPWTFLASAEYVRPLANDHKGYLRADYQYTTAQRALLPNQDPNNAINDSTLPGLPDTRNLSLRAGWRFNGIDLSVFANNVTDSHPILFQSRDVPAAYDSLYFQRTFRPRTVGLTGTYRY